jgi:hypothetical protein
MKHNNKQATYLAWCLVFLSSIIHAESRITIAPGVMNFDYVETDVDGGFLDGERGDIPGIKLGIDAKDSPFFTLGLVVEYFAGNVDYDGHIESLDSRYDGLPLSTTTDQKIFSFSAALKQRVINDPEIFLYGNLSYKKWERDIQGTTLSGIDNFGDPFTNLAVSGLFETYKWWQVTFGALTKFSLPKDTEIEIYAGFLRTIEPQMDLAVFTFDLEEEWGYEGGLSLFYKLDNRQRLGISSSIMYWKFGRSDVILGFVEPDSESEMKTVQLIYDLEL